MSLDQTIDWFAGEPYDTAVRRIVRRVTVDATALRLLKRAHERGAPGASATYAWALGWALGAGQTVDPLLAADVYQAAVDQSPDDPALWFGSALAHSGAFGGRRSMPLGARRGFANAARLDADNALAHLALAAARQTVADADGAERCTLAALAAPVYRPYASPLADELLAEAPWLGQPLATLDPDRVAGLQRYAAGGMLARARRLPQPVERGRALLGLGVTLADGPRQTRVVLNGVSLMRGALALLRELGVAGAELAQAELKAVADTLVVQRRELDERFEREAGKVLGAAGAGAGGGLLGTLIGLARSRRRWPVPIPLALPGKTIAGLGLGLMFASVSTALAENPLTAARRRAVERELVAAEAEMTGAAVAQLRRLAEGLGAGGLQPTG